MPNLRAFIIGAALTLVVVLVLFSPEADDSPQMSQPATEVATEGATQPQEAGTASRCVDTPSSMQSVIEEELIDVHGEYRVTLARAVRSDDFARAHFVSTMMFASGVEDGEILTWLVAGELDSPNMWLSADRITEEFSHMPYAGSTDIGHVLNSPGYSEVRRCVGGAGLRD